MVDMGTCVLCGGKLPHKGACPEIERRGKEQTTALMVNRNAFLDGSPPRNFRSFLGDDLYESMKLMPVMSSIRDLPDGGETSMTDIGMHGVDSFRFTRELTGSTQVINGDTYVVFEERRRGEFKLKKEPKHVLDFFKKR